MNQVACSNISVKENLFADNLLPMISFFFFFLQGEGGMFDKVYVPTNAIIADLVYTKNVLVCLVMTIL